MNKAELCPVCKGSGIYTKAEIGTAKEHEKWSCHGCNGTGWVEVGYDPPHYHPPHWPYYPFTCEPYKVTYWTTTTGDLPE